MSSKQHLIGAHVSIAGGFFKAIDRGETIGANCIQIFTKSNRQWYAKNITPDDIDLFLHTQKKSNIKIVVAHASYLINLGSSSHIAHKSVQALADELQRCEMLHIPYLVLHPGTYSLDDKEANLKLVAQHINEALEIAHPKKTMLLLETMAGQGSIIGQTIEELATILQHVQHKKHVGVCLDTCHIFAAGYQLDSKKNYLDFWKKIDATIGIDKIKVIHINDSKKECGSKVDRHEHIGQGRIPTETFKLLLQDAKLQDVPKILETPKEPDEVIADQKNIAKLYSYTE